MQSYPKITFGIIVLNGEPFTRYCLRSLYPFAHEIIVVEGGHEDAKSMCTPGGHSIDGTLETLYKFKNEEDPEGKLTIITRDGFWPKKDELGRNRPQSRAYAERATGDYLWQIDIDEFYKKEDMREIISMLKDNPAITEVSFKQKSFWGGIDYLSESYALMRTKGGWHRIFKWGKDYKYLTHEPPTVLDEMGVDQKEIDWVSGEKMARKNIFFYHYSLLFPFQVEQKVKVYRDEKPNECAGIIDWANKNYFKITNPYRIHNLYRVTSWLKRFKGTHPEQIENMMKDIEDGKIFVKVRSNEDVELLLKSPKYKIGKFFVEKFEPFDLFIRQFIFNAGRIKNIPGKVKKLRHSFFSR